MTLLAQDAAGLRYHSLLVAGMRQVAVQAILDSRLMCVALKPKLGNLQMTVET